MRLMNNRTAVQKKERKLKHGSKGETIGFLKTGKKEAMKKTLLEYYVISYSVRVRTFLDASNHICSVNRLSTGAGPAPFEASPDASSTGTCGAWPSGAFSC